MTSSSTKEIAKPVRKESSRISMTVYLKCRQQLSLISSGWTSQAYSEEEGVLRVQFPHTQVAILHVTLRVVIQSA